MKYVGDFEEKFIEIRVKCAIEESESRSDIVSMFTTKNTTADIHLDHACTFLRNLSSTSSIRDTPMYEKDVNSLVARRVEQLLLSVIGFTGNKQNENKKMTTPEKGP